MQTIALSIVPWRDRAVRRVIELTEEHTLHDAHLAIQRALDLDKDHPYAFFLNNRAHDPTFEFGHVDSGARHRADESRLGALGLVARKRFVYVFDLGDDLRHDVQVVGFDRAEAGIQYPRVVESIGAAPPRYPNPEDDEADGDAAWYESDGLDEDGGEAGDGDPPPRDDPPLRPDLEPLASRLLGLVESEDDRRFMFDSRRYRRVGAPERMEEERRLALDILSAAARDRTALDYLSDAIDFDVDFWLAELPIDLSKLGKYEEAVDLAAHEGGEVGPDRRLTGLVRHGRGELRLTFGEAPAPLDAHALPGQRRVCLSLLDEFAGGQDVDVVDLHDLVLPGAGAVSCLSGPTHAPSSSST
jgi:hypothetical protein